MSLFSSINYKRAVRTAFATAVLAFPLLGAGECDALTGSSDDSSQYDGLYQLVKVETSSMPYIMYQADARNKLVLKGGCWTLSGTTLRTEMYLETTLNGVTTRSPYWPERHTGEVTFSGSTATGTLDSKSYVTSTFSSGTMLTTNNNLHMQFTKVTSCVVN